MKISSIVQKNNMAPAFLIQNTTNLQLNKHKYKKNEPFKMVIFMDLF